MHDCPGGCGERVIYARLTCIRCWARLPQPLRDDVNRAYRQRGRNPVRHLRAVSAALNWYKAERP
jgi:hypothetical protein